MHIPGAGGGSPVEAGYGANVVGTRDRQDTRNKGVWYNDLTFLQNPIPYSEFVANLDELSSEMLLLQNMTMQFW